MAEPRCKTCNDSARVPCPFYSGIEARDCAKGQELECPEPFHGDCWLPCPDCEADEKEATE